MTADTKPELCLALDKWGEWNCYRPKGHELNNADHKAHVHRSYFNGRTYEWTGNREGKLVGFGR